MNAVGMTVLIFTLFKKNLASSGTEDGSLPGDF